MSINTKGQLGKCVVAVIGAILAVYCVVQSGRLNAAYEKMGYLHAEANIQKDQNEKLQDVLDRYVTQIDELQRITAEQQQAIKQQRQFTNEELQEVIGVVAAESGNQPLEGQMLVAQCIYDRYMTSYGGAMTIHEILTARDQFAAPLSCTENFPKAYEAVVRVFLYGERITQKECIYFYNPVTANKKAVVLFEANNEYLTTIGDHVFRSW